MTAIRIPCPLCAGTGNHTLGGGRENRMDTCARCGGEGTIDAATGLTREASADPRTGQAQTYRTDGAPTEEMLLAGIEAFLAECGRQDAANSLPSETTYQRGLRIGRLIVGDREIEAAFRAMVAAQPGRPDTSQPREARERVERVRHVRRGTEYDILFRAATVQTDTPLSDFAQVVVYRGDDGVVWVRPVTEMDDGRFVPALSQSQPHAGDMIGLREALTAARSQIVTLGGNPGDDPDGDRIQAAVLSSVDAALTRTKPERNGVAETDVVAKAKQLCAETCSPKDTGDGKHSCPDCTAEFYGEWITDARAALAQTPPPPATGRVDVAGGVPSEEEIAAAIRANVVARWMGSDSFVEGFEEAAHAVLALLTPDHPAGDDAGTGRAA